MQINIIGTYMKSILGQNKQQMFMEISQKKQIKWDRLVYKILKNSYELNQARRL